MNLWFDSIVCASMVYPPYPTINFMVAGEKKTRIMPRVRKHVEDPNSNSFPVFINTIDGKKMHSVNLTKKLNEDFEEIISIRFVSNKKLKVEFSSFKSANMLVESQEYLKEYNIYVPFVNNEVKGRIPIHADVPDKDIFDHMKIFEFGNANSSSKILEVRRITIFDQVKNEKIPVDTVVVTFSGNKIPKTVEYEKLIIPVFMNVENVLQCKNCFAFGHSKNACRGIKKCENCGKKEHSIEELCTVECTNCHLAHKSNSKICDVFKKKKEKEVEKAKLTTLSDEKKKITENLYSHFAMYPSLAAPANFVKCPTINGNIAPIPSTSGVVEKIDNRNRVPIKRFREDEQSESLLIEESVDTPDICEMALEIFNADLNWAVRVIDEIKKPGMDCAKMLHFATAQRLSNILEDLRRNPNIANKLLNLCNSQPKMF